MTHPLITLAKNTLNAHFSNKEVSVSLQVKKKFSEKKACFVTLTINGDLRGCIGSLYPRQELYKEVMANAINAAFGDPRFPPLSEYELNQIHIEISILDIPKKLNFSSPSDLLNKLTKNEGVILQRGFRSATYLPQVWDDLPDKEEFLSSLCQKAGLPSDSWKHPDCLIQVYTVKKIKE